MFIEFRGRRYEALWASDVVNDTFALELWDCSGKRELVLLALRSDTTREISFSAYRDDLPFEMVEWFVARRPSWRARDEAPVDQPREQP